MKDKGTPKWQAVRFHKGSFHPAKAKKAILSIFATERFQHGTISLSSCRLARHDYRLFPSLNYAAPRPNVSFLITRPGTRRSWSRFLRRLRVGPNSLFALLEERIRSGLKRLKNRLLMSTYMPRPYMVCPSNWKARWVTCALQCSKFISMIR